MRYCHEKERMNQAFCKEPGCHLTIKTIEKWFKFAKLEPSTPMPSPAVCWRMLLVHPRGDTRNPAAEINGVTGTARTNAERGQDGGITGEHSAFGTPIRILLLILLSILMVIICSSFEK